ncbi:MAG: efflux transporter outer membrane subunit [Candidatus Binatia bacterium]
MKRSASAVRMLRATLLALPLLGGCMLGPNYKRPELTMPVGWRDAPVEAAYDGVAYAESLANTPWWELFQDPQLQALIRIALTENQDLLIAVERITEARARLGFVRADLFPKVDLTTDVSRFEQSREGFPNNAPPVSNDAMLYGLSADVFWELDLFGRIRRATEAERALLLATEEGRRAVAISLVAAVATTYVELRDADLRLQISRRTLASRAKSLDLTRVRFEGGLTSQKDPMQAEAEYRRVEVTVFQLEQRVRQVENALSVLIGRTPGDIARGTSLPDLPVALTIPAGLPSELLDRRPDLRAAEEQLHAATADVGAAKALLFPRIALTAGYGTASTEFDALFTGSSQAWSVASGLVQPIFNAGKNLRRVQIAESQMRQSLYAYEKTVLQALREVEDSLIAWQQTGAARGSQRMRVAAERKVVELTSVRYEGGVTDYLEVLDSQRSLFAAELDEVQTISAQLISLVQLYKALGGGWPTEPEVAAAPDANRN